MNLHICCNSMRILIRGNQESQCHITLDEDLRLNSCDDLGDRMPPIEFCPWCGQKVRGIGRLDV